MRRSIVVGEPGADDTLCVVVPIKALRDAKQRLAAVLSPQERGDLVLAMARDVLDAVIAVVGRRHVRVCCGDEAGAELARQLGVGVLRDQAGHSGLNAIVTDAATALSGDGYRRLLVIHADLPWLSAADVAAASGFAADQLLLVPDHSGDGSNLLGWGLRTGFIAGYGEGSCARHRARAAAAGLRLHTPELPWASLDVDCPQDLALLAGAAAADRALATRRWVAAAGLAERLAGAASVRNTALR